MSQYMKPLIRLAVTSANSTAVGDCTISDADLELIQSVIGGADMDNVFAASEDCKIQVELDMYCKFTSVELGAVQVFMS